MNKSYSLTSNSYTKIGKYFNYAWQSTRIGWPDTVKPEFDLKVFGSAIWSYGKFRGMSMPWNQAGKEHLREKASYNHAPICWPVSKGNCSYIRGM